MRENQRASIRYRRAVSGDAAGIATVGVETWKTTYRGIMPDSMLDNQDYEARRQRWADRLADPTNPQTAFVAEAGQDDGKREIVGFASSGPNDHDDKTFAGEIKALYVLAAYQGQGIGRSLVALSAQELQRRGINSLLLWVLTANPARGFYEHMGGVYLRLKPWECDGVTLSAALYGWRDTAELAALAPPLDA